jgi:hypothetical protein
VFSPYSDWGDSFSLGENGEKEGKQLGKTQTYPQLFLERFSFR